MTQHTARQSDLKAGGEFLAALRVLTDNLPEGELVARVLSDLNSRIGCLERKDGGWERKPLEDDAA